MVAIAAMSPLYTESRRDSPPQYRGATFVPNALQSCESNTLSPAASTTNTVSTGGTQTARTACQSMGLPASAAYCLGAPPAKRVPLPAAGIRAKTDNG